MAFEPRYLEHPESQPIWEGEVTYVVKGQEPQTRRLRLHKEVSPRTDQSDLGSPIRSLSGISSGVYSPMMAS